MSRVSPRAATIVLIPGFKSDRRSMIPYARFLRAGGYNVLLYDSRGTGESAGTFSLGLHEVDDVRGAVAYLERRADLQNHQIGLLGVSLGSGIGIVAARHLSAVRALVADSPYADESAEVDRLDSVHVGRFAIPFLPIAPFVVDRLLGASLSSFSPLRASPAIPPRGLLLIHSRHDANPTTPLSAAIALRRAACCTAQLWIAPHGGHAGALAAQSGQYKTRVLRFFHRFLSRK